MRIQFTVFLMALLPLSAADVQSALLNVQNTGYVKNMEGSDFSTRTPRTLFGNVLLGTIDFAQQQNTLQLGAIGIIPFNEPYLIWGDYHGGKRFDESKGRSATEKTEYDRPVQLIQPFVSYRFEGKHNDFVFGSFRSEHPWHELIKYDVYEFLRPAETGFQLLYNKHPELYQELYINWELTNQPDQKENFHVGSISSWKPGASSVSAQIFYLHRGGGEYPQEPIVSENISAALPVQLGMALPFSFVTRIAVESVPLYTLDEPDREDKSTWNNGKGVLNSLVLENRHHTIKTGYWTGEKVYAEEGLPFSKASRFAYIDYELKTKLGETTELLIRFSGGAFGDSLSKSFVDQKMILRWRGNLTLFQQKNAVTTQKLDNTAAAEDDTLPQE